MANRLSQEAVEVLIAGTSKARLSQEAVEVVISHSGTARAGLSQLAVEVLVTVDKECDVPFIASVTQVYGPSIVGNIAVPFIGSVTTLYTPTLVGPSTEVDVPFIPSSTAVYGIFSIFSDTVGIGPGNGGEINGIELAPSGTSVTATLAAPLSTTSTLLQLTGDSGLPNTFCLVIDDEVVYVAKITSGSYRIRGRALSNTTLASHLSGVDATWTDTYDMAIESQARANANFTADIESSGSNTYYGFLQTFDSTQGYLSGSRYAMCVTEVVGVFDAGAGTTGTNRLDSSQPNAICTPLGITDDCPVAMTVPALITSDINTGDVCVVRYTNTEASILTLGSRAVGLMPWYGMMRVDSTNHDVTLTDPTGNIVDGSINGEWFEPFGPGIAPDTGLPTVHDVPYTSVTLLGSDRTFTHGGLPSPPNYNDTGWPMCALAVRQGKRRVPGWRSWDWHDYNYVYTGFETDATFVQLLINRNGIVFASVPEVELPGPQDIDGPDAVWDDKTYYFGASWFVALYGPGSFFLSGPPLNGSVDGGPLPGGGPTSSPTGTVTFPGGVPTVTIPPTVEGGSGGDINPPSIVGNNRFYATLT